MAINVITVSGNIGKDCEQRWTQNSKAISTFSLPVKQGYGEHEKVVWVNCKMFGAKAEKLPEYLKKGTKVTVTGEFTMDEWTDRDGAKRSIPVIIVSGIDFGSNGKQQDAGAGNHYDKLAGKQPAQHQEPPMDFDDDIPW